MESANVRGDVDRLETLCPELSPCLVTPRFGLREESRNDRIILVNLEPGFCRQERGQDPTLLVKPCEVVYNGGAVVGGGSHLGPCPE